MHLLGPTGQENHYCLVDLAVLDPQPVQHRQLLQYLLCLLVSHSGLWVLVYLGHLLSQHFPEFQASQHCQQIQYLLANQDCLYYPVVLEDQAGQLDQQDLVNQGLLVVLVALVCLKFRVNQSVRQNLWDQQNRLVLEILVVLQVQRGHLLLEVLMVHYHL